MVNSGSFDAEEQQNAKSSFLPSSSPTSSQSAGPVTANTVLLCKTDFSQTADSVVEHAIEPTATKTEFNSLKDEQTESFTRVVVEEQPVERELRLNGEPEATKLCCSLPLDKVQGVLTTYQQNGACTSTLEEEQAKTVKQPSRKLLCLYCERTFVSANLRQKHVERCHSLKQNRRVSSRRQNPLTVTPCIFCNKLNTSEHTLQDLFVHLLNDHSNKYFACLQCEDRFLSPSNLNDHNTLFHPPVIPQTQEPSRVELEPLEDEEEEELPVKLTRSRVKSKMDLQLNVRTPGRKKLRDLSVKTSRIALKRSKRLQTKPEPPKITRRTRKSTPSISQPQTSNQDKKPVTSVNPYPEFDSFYRVKKITDHSIDNLKISSLTFDDVVFDKAFFNRIKCNIQENLLHHIDGKLFKNEESETRISNFEKISGLPQEVQSSTTENFGCDLSLNAVTPITSFSLSQFGDDLESQIEYGSKPSKKKPREEVHYKYFTRRKFQASILEQKENRDLSKLDMWTQLVIKKRQQKMLDDKKTPKEMLEYTAGDEYKNKLKREELNRILDRRGPFEDLKEEATKMAALDKLNSTSSESISAESFSEVREVLNDILLRVFEEVEPVKLVEEPTPFTQPQEPPSYLNLRHATSLPPDEIDRSDKIALICSSQETENYELPTNKVREEHEMVELTGEWARCRMYICAACGRRLPNMKMLLDHKSAYHQNVWVQHYEFVGNQNELYPHLAIPGLGKVGIVENTIQCKFWRRSEARVCTKCGKQCNALAELHRHILECGGDWTWMLARKKLKYRPYGARSRKKRRGLVKRCHHQQQVKTNNNGQGEKKTLKKTFEGPRPKPSDAETIQRMLANLPAKRSTRKLISLQDNYKARKKPIQNNTTTMKCGKMIYRNTNNQESNPNNSNPSKPSMRKSVRNINKVLSSRILDSTASMIMKRKLRNLTQRVTRQTKQLVEPSPPKEVVKPVEEVKEEVVKRSSPRLEKPPAEDKPKKMSVKKILTSKINIKSFFPVKKKTTSGNNTESSEVTKRTTRRSAGLVEPPKQQILQKLGFRNKKPSSEKTNEPTEDKSQKRKLTRSFRNVINRIKKPKVDLETIVQVDGSPSKKQEASNESPNFLEETADEEDDSSSKLEKIVTPSTVIEKNEPDPIVQAYHDTKEDPPIPETIFNLDSSNEKSLQAKGLDFEEKEIKTLVPEVVALKSLELDMGGEAPELKSPNGLSMLSPKQKAKLRKPTRGLNDCIAMLTSKLQQKPEPQEVMEEIPEVKPMVSLTIPQVSLNRPSFLGNVELKTPIYQKKECILRIPNFKQKLVQDLAPPPVQNDDCALDLTTKPAITCEPQIVEQFIPKPHFNSIDHIIEAVVENRIADVVKDTLILQEIGPLAAKPPKKEVSVQTRVEPPIFRTNLDETIDFVANGGSTVEPRKIGSIRKPKVKKAPAMPVLCPCISHNDMLHDNQHHNHNNAFVDFQSDVTATLRSKKQPNKKVGQVRKRNTPCFQNCLAQPNYPMLETNLDTFLGVKEIIAVPQMPTMALIPADMFEGNFELINEDEPNMLENKIVPPEFLEPNIIITSDSEDDVPLSALLAGDSSKDDGLVVENYAIQLGDGFNQRINALQLTNQIVQISGGTIQFQNGVGTFTQQPIIGASLLEAPPSAVLEPAPATQIEPPVLMMAPPPVVKETSDVPEAPPILLPEASSVSSEAPPLIKVQSLVEEEIRSKTPVQNEVQALPEVAPPPAQEEPSNKQSKGKTKRKRASRAKSRKPDKVSKVQESKSEDSAIEVSDSSKLDENKEVEGLQEVMKPLEVLPEVENLLEVQTAVEKLSEELPKKEDFQIIEELVKEVPISQEVQEPIEEVKKPEAPVEQEVLPEAVEDLLLSPAESSSSPDQDKSAILEKPLKASKTKRRGRSKKSEPFEALLDLPECDSSEIKLSEDILSDTCNLPEEIQLPDSTKRDKRKSKNAKKVEETNTINSELFESFSLVIKKNKSRRKPNVVVLENSPVEDFDSSPIQDACNEDSIELMDMELEESPVHSTIIERSPIYPPVEDLQEETEEDPKRITKQSSFSGKIEEEVQQEDDKKSKKTRRKKSIEPALEEPVKEVVDPNQTTELPEIAIKPKSRRKKRKQEEKLPETSEEAEEENIPLNLLRAEETKKDEVVTNDLLIKEVFEEIKENLCLDEDKVEEAVNKLDETLKKDSLEVLNVLTDKKKNKRKKSKTIENMLPNESEEKIIQVADKLEEPIENHQPVDENILNNFQVETTRIKPKVKKIKRKKNKIILNDVTDSDDIFGPKNNLNDSLDRKRTKKQKIKLNELEVDENTFGIEENEHIKLVQKEDFTNLSNFQPLIEMDEVDCSFEQKQIVSPKKNRNNKKPVEDINQNMSTSMEVKENEELEASNGRRKISRSAKSKALENILDDALSELTESQRNREILGAKEVVEVSPIVEEPPVIKAAEELVVEDQEPEGECLRRSRRSSRKITSYNENELAEPILEVLENGKRKNRKNKSPEKVEPETKLNTDQLFDLLKASTDFVPVVQTKIDGEGAVKKDVDKIYEFTESSPENTLEVIPVVKSRARSKVSVSETTTSSIDFENSSSMPVESPHYCDICKKSFTRSESLAKHKRTLTHISKLSEIEAKMAEQAKQEQKPETKEEVQEPSREPVEEEKQDISISNLLQTSTKPPDSPIIHSYINSSNHSLKLADIINDVLNKPVENEENHNFSDIIMQQTPLEPEVRRYKSLGERKSFDSENSLNSSPFYETTSKTTLVEKQISLLENIIEHQTGTYIDDISLSSSGPLDEPPLPSEDSNTFPIPSIKPSTPPNNFVKPNHYEEISEDSINIRNSYEQEQKLRKTLNRDEELFLECCSLLKSGSEVSSSYSKKKLELQHHNEEPEFLETKSLEKVEVEDYSNCSRAITPLGNLDPEVSDSNTISSNWNVTARELAEGASPTRSPSFTFGEVQEEDSQTHKEKSWKNSISKFGGMISKTINAVGKKLTRKPLVEDLFVDSKRIDELSDGGSTCDSKKMLTKGAMKVFEGLKVSIPTEDLDLEEVLNCSPPGKKADLEKLKPDQGLLPKPLKTTRKSKPIKNKSQLGSNLLFKINKTKTSSKSEKKKKHGDLEVVSGNDKSHDVYDFEETQDNSDVFVKPDFRSFRTTKKDGEDEDLGKKAKSVQNITKKKCMIMGRIFKNAAKSKTDEEETRAEIPTVENAELAENFVVNSSPKPRLSEQEINSLFDKLKEDDKKIKPPPNFDGNNKKKIKLKRKRVRANSDSTDDEFSINTNKKRLSKKNTKPEESCINLEQELKECIGVASRKSQRKCTSGKQNVLVEHWSSDESAFEALLETQKLEPKEVLPVKLVEAQSEEVKPKELQVLPDDKKVVQKKRKTSKPLKVSSSNSETYSAGLNNNRRKRAAPLYHWSSSSEDESQDLIEVKPIRDEIDDDEDRPVQHGWIVGDSPKKLVTMLAQAKGSKKIDADCVKEQGKKRTNTVS